MSQLVVSERPVYRPDLQVDPSPSLSFEETENPIEDITKRTLLAPSASSAPSAPPKSPSPSHHRYSYGKPVIEDPDLQGYMHVNPYPGFEDSFESVEFTKEDHLKFVACPEYAEQLEEGSKAYRKYCKKILLELFRPIYNYNFGVLRHNCVDALTNFLQQILKYAIEGVKLSHFLPACLVVWDKVLIESTLERRNRYLREFKGNQFIASEECIRRNHNQVRQFKVSGAETIPIVGTISGLTLNLWFQIREIAVIASIHGHDVNDADVQKQIFQCLAIGNAMKIASLSTDGLVIEISKLILDKWKSKNNLLGIIPLNFIFNYFTEDAAKVSGHARRVFTGEHTKPIPESAYR